MLQDTILTPVVIYNILQEDTETSHRYEISPKNNDCNYQNLIKGVTITRPRQPINGQRTLKRKVKKPMKYCEANRIMERMIVSIHGQITRIF